ncbi:MAG: hypothetical protein C4523_12245 [Myxococcales bacterium]|nr:MAG: hypothetical protein C4523_12245 [Myxococcales bacterium]
MISLIFSRMASGSFCFCDPMEFVIFEGGTGVIEATFFPDVYRRFCARLDYGRLYLLSARRTSSSARRR